MEVPSRGRRVAAYAVLVGYLLVVVGSALGGHPLTDGLRNQVTRPVEKLLGIHQTWPMFATAPRGTRWLELHAERRDGSRAVLDALPGRPDPYGLRITYDRLGKLQRNAAATRRKKLREGLVRWMCRREAAAGRPLRKVQPVRGSTQTPPPGSGRKRREDLFVSHERFGRWNCR
ncbi:MAG: hypothetical protein AAF211_11715 [Myxococcota bacterium]